MSGAVVWLTGLSASGKTTLAQALAERLGHPCYVLDGDVVRRGLSSDLGFSPEDRVEHLRRMGHVAAMMADAGLLVIAAFISPYRTSRAEARRTVGTHRFMEVYVAADLATCEARDPKGLYQRARAGEIERLPGLSEPYEPPQAAELTLQTGTLSVDQCVQQLYQAVLDELAIDS
jgi:adenylyl-sulfate kinase